MDTTIIPTRCGIYKIKNIVTGDKYIGSAVDIDSRWACHLSTLRSCTHHNRYLQRAWNKYGEAAFEFEVIEECAPCDLIQREQSYLPEEKTFDALRRNGFYNLRPIADSSLGVKFSEETKARIGNKARDRLSDPDRRAFMSTIAKRQWEDAGTRERLLSNQDLKKKLLTERNRKNWSDPEYSAARATGMKERWSDTDYRESVSRKIKEGRSRKKRERLILNGQLSLFE